MQPTPDPRLFLGRRRLIGAAALGAAGLALEGCTGAGARPALAAGPPRPSLCLPPVKVARERIIRETVGLRPFRDGGFVVRGETLGTKRLVHNYGHGGAGISLCWGTARLATLLGLPGHSGPVAVIGAGVAGLTTARLVQEAGFPVTVYAKAVTPHTTSDVAGGQWLPTGYFDYDAIDDAFRAQNGAAVDYSYRRYQLLVGEEYGVRWITNYFETQPPPPDASVSGSPTQPDWRRLTPAEHPFPLEHVRQHQLMLIEPPRFLRRLMRDIQTSGGRIAIRSFAAPQEIAALPETLVFNCTGLGTKELFGDPQLVAVRGQLVTLLPQPEVDYAAGTRTGYMFPRRDGIVLGGTFQRGQTSTDPDPATTDRILASHKAVFDAFRCLPADRA